MLCSSWTNPQMTASLHWELRLLHNFNQSKNRLALMVGELTCKTEDWTKQRRPRSQPSPQFKPPPPLYLESAPHLLKILKMDFFAHSLLISSLSWHLDFLTTPHMGTILSDLQDRSFTLPHFNCDLPFITQRPAENGRFSKNGIEFPSLKQFGICWRNIFWYFLGERGWQANHGAPSNPADKHRQHLLADLNLIPLHWKHKIPRLIKFDARKRINFWSSDNMSEDSGVGHIIDGVCRA